MTTPSPRAKPRGLFWCRREKRSLGFARDDGWSSQPQHHLRDDALLDLVAAAVDRGLAIVEVARRSEVRVLRPDRLLVAALPQEAGQVRRRIFADRFHGELGDALLYLRAADLEARHFRPRLAAVRHLRQHAQLGELQRRHLDLEVSDLLGEALVLDQRLAVVLLGAGDVLQRLDAALGL